MVRVIIILYSLLFPLMSHTAMTLGNTHGSIQLIEIYDYECPHCHRMVSVKPNVVIAMSGEQSFATLQGVIEHVRSH